MRRHWLVKSEPGSYSIDDLERDGRTSWEGVRNYQARNLIREMSVGDEVLFYHSSTDPPAVAGLARVATAAHPDPTARDSRGDYHDPRASDEDPRWYTVDLEFAGKFTRPVPLAILRETPGLEEMILTKKSRLSVQPVTQGEFEIIARMGRG